MREEERGSVMIEVMVSAILLTIAAIGVFNAFDAATRSTAQERHRAQAHGLAQADLARMRTMRISQLSPFLDETRTLSVDGTPYTVDSEADFINATTGTDTCDEENASADYIRIRSTVTWPSIGVRKPVRSESLVAPPNSTAKAESGALIVEVVNAAHEPRIGVPIVGSGPTPFSRETGDNGCAVFGNLLKGDYVVTATVPGTIDPEGKESGSADANVVAEATSTLTLEFDKPGTIETEFVTRPESATGPQVPAKALAFSAYHTRLSEARAFKSENGTPQLKLKATTLFPFDTPYAVYAGACEANNPDPNAESPSEAIVDVDVVPGETATAKVEMPALRLKVYKGEEGKTSELSSGATVKIKDGNCTSAGLPQLVHTTNVKGELSEPGLPYSRVKSSSGGYTVCVSGIATDGQRRRVTKTNVSVPALATDIPAGTSLNIYLRNGSSSSGGLCP